MRLAKEFGRKVATAAEARKIMKVGTWYDSVEETLQNNGMPPNPTEFNPGFLTWPTDGKIKPPVIGGDFASDRSLHDCTGAGPGRTSRVDGSEEVTGDDIQ